MINQTSSFITPASQQCEITVDKLNEELEIVEEPPKKHCITKFCNWLVSNPKKSILFLVAGTATIATCILLGTYINSVDNNSPVLANRNITVAPSRGLLLLNKKSSASSHINILPITSIDSTMSIKTTLVSTLVKPIINVTKKLSLTSIGSTTSIKTTLVSSALKSSINPTKTFTKATTSRDSTTSIETTLISPALKLSINPTKTVTKATTQIFSTVNINFEEISRPYAEYERAGNLLISDDDINKLAYYEYYEATKIKQTIVKNLPKNVDLVVYTTAENTKKAQRYIRRKYRRLIDRERFHILSVKKNSDTVTKFWARDALPVPVYDKNGKLALVDAQYHHNFEQDQHFANFFNVTLYSHEYEFEGGNFLADSNGNCFTIDNKYIPKSNDFFKKYYGCNRTTRFQHIKGIGHMDESIKIIDSKNILTDVPQYRTILQGLGYNVTLMPRPTGSTKKSYANYLNSLLINNRLFLPIYNKDSDAEAIQIYKNFNLTVFPLVSTKLAKNKQGSIHCITMTYPPV